MLLDSRFVIGQRRASFALLLAFSLQPLASLHAATTITTANHYAYGANVGWMECRGDVTGGAVIGEYVCSGYVYAANAGWIHLGDSTPANGISYQNNSAIDYGVNHDGLGNLRGYAYGANIGWINFESTGAPKVDLRTGKFSGHAWSANCGWLSLSNAQAVVQTASIAAGTDSDGDGIADAWERTYTNTLTAFNASSDTDGDGQTDKDEALADTNPLDAKDVLRITDITRESPPGTYTTLAWPGKTTRFYAAQRRDALEASGSWLEFFTATSSGNTWLGFDVNTNRQFFRIRAFRPLMP